MSPSSSCTIMRASLTGTFLLLVSWAALVACNNQEPVAVQMGHQPSSCNSENVGRFYYSHLTKRLSFCDGYMFKVLNSGPGVHVGQLGSYNNPAPSCSALGPNLRTGAYWIKTAPSATTFKIFCDFLLRPQGCALVWKHSYYQVTPNNDMRTFSTVNKACTDLDDGWCNIANKDVIDGSEQMTVAYHHGHVVYAYRGDRHPQLGKTWQGAILNNPQKVIDKCTSNQGIPPEPSNEHGITGLTMDKHNPGVYTGNCDTDRYNKGGECRWDNCRLPKTISTTATHVQMTVAIYVC